MHETIQISIPIAEEQVREQLIAELSSINFDAFEERDDELLAFIESVKFDEMVLESILTLHNLKFTKTVIEAQNWNAVWESNFQPVVVNDFCAIRADFHPPFTELQHEIIITP